MARRIKKGAAPNGDDAPEVEQFGYRLDHDSRDKTSGTQASDKQCFTYSNSALDSAMRELAELDLKFLDAANNRCRAAIKAAVKLAEGEADALCLKSLRHPRDERPPVDIDASSALQDRILAALVERVMVEPFNLAPCGAEKIDSLLRNAFINRFVLLSRKIYSGGVA